MAEGQTAENKNLAYYCYCFSEIKVYRNEKKGGDALNQPVLLLSLIDLITQGLVKENYIYISDDLINTFKKYWSILTSNSFKGSDFALPFFHLKNAKGKFWHLKFSDGYEGGRPQTIPTLKRDVDYATLDPELFELLQYAEARTELIDSLIATWFSCSQKEIEEILQINQSLEDSSLAELEEQGEVSEVEKKKLRVYLKKSLVREAFFRKAVIHLYDYRCAFCRMKVTRSLNQSIVDGAHIKPFSKFFDSQVDNGISLCKNHHWAFDQGWFGIDDHYKIIVASDLEEESPNSKKLMKDFQGEFILLPNSELNLPRLEALQWHRKNVFQQNLNRRLQK